MVKIADILAHVERLEPKNDFKGKTLSIKPGESINEAIKGYREHLESKWSDGAPKLPESKSETTRALNKLQNEGLSQKMPDLPEVTIVGEK